MTEKTDEQLAEEVQRGDIQRYGLLVERYEAKMSRYARRFLFGYEDSKDIVQEVFLRAFTNIQSFDPNRPFSSWLYRIAHNLFLNAIKKKGHEPLLFFDPDTLFPHPAAPDQADTEIQKTELKKMLEECLNLLDPKYREPLILYYYEDMDYQKISEIMRIPPSTVGVRLGRGKTTLKKVYNKLHPNE